MTAAAHGITRFSFRPTKAAIRDMRIAELETLAKRLGLRWGGVEKGNIVTVYFEQRVETFRGLPEAERWLNQWSDEKRKKPHRWQRTYEWICALVAYPHNAPVYRQRLAAKGIPLSRDEQAWDRYEAAEQAKDRAWEAEHAAALRRNHQKARAQVLALLAAARQTDARRCLLHTIATKDPTKVAYIEGLLEDGMPVATVLYSRYGGVLYYDDVFEGTWKGMPIRIACDVNWYNFTWHLNQATHLHFNSWTANLLCKLHDYGALWTNQPIGDRYVYLG
jgi:hypothetical protein